MKTLLKILMKIPVDKLLHSYISMILTMFVYALFNNVIVAVLTALLVGVIKEIYDAKETDKLDIPDIIADLSGMAIATTIILLS